MCIRDSALSDAPVSKPFIPVSCAIAGPLTIAAEKHARNATAVVIRRAGMRKYAVDIYYPVICFIIWFVIWFVIWIVMGDGCVPDSSTII